MEKNLLRIGVVLTLILFINTTLIAQQFERLPVINSETQRTGRNQLERMPVRNEAQPVPPGTASNPQQRSLTVLAGGSDVLVNNNDGASGTGRFTQSETSVIAFGNQIVVGFNDAGSNFGSANKFTGWSYSSNNGASFTDGGTLPTNAIGDAGDPLLARNDNTGRIYFATLGFTNGNVIQIFRSDDNGVSWMLPVNGTPGGLVEDKPWLTVDNVDGPGNGNVYLLSRRFGGAQGIYFYRSLDHGATYSSGSLIVSNMQGAFLTVSPDHSIHAFWYDGPSGSIKVRKSVDFGVSFGAAVTVASGLVGGVNGNLNLVGLRQGTSISTTFRSNEFPHAYVNPVSGHLYVTYNNDGPGADKADVFMVMSTNGGATWSPALKINDDATTTDQWMPTIAVTPDGLNVGVFYYSRQEDPLNNNLFKYYGRIGSIVGSTVTFAPSFAISDVPSLPEFGRDNVVNSVYMGDYNQVATTPNTFHVVWSDNRDDLSGGAPRKDPNVYYDQISLAPPVDPTVFYSKAAGDLHNLATWGVNPDGSGTNPANFGSGKTFNLANRSGIYAMTGSWTVEGLIVNPPGSQLQINGFTLTEAGMSGGGTIKGSPTSTLRVLGISGGEAGPLAFTPGGQTLDHFLLDRAGGSATLITPLEIYNTFNVTNGSFITGGMLTLNSDAAGTARVSPLPPSGVIGEVTIERYIPARRAWRILTAPINGGQTIFQSWQENRNNTMPDPNPFPGFGTHITGGPVFGSAANGFDQNPGASSSIKFYNSATDAWSPLPNTNASFPGLSALMVFIRGDRGIALGPNNVPPVPTTLRAKGTLLIGNALNFINATGFTAVPNPFASPVDFALMDKENVQNSLWVWDPKMGGVNGVGAFVNVSFNGTTWDVTPASVSPISQIIQSGQGFLVKATGGVTGVLTISESDKSATPALDVFRTVKTSGMRVSLLGKNDDQSTDLLDEFFSSYAATYASKIDQFDVSKAGNIEENLAIENGDDLLMVERRPELAKEDQIRMKIWNLKEKNYVLELNPVNLGSTGVKAWLVDDYTQTVTPIALDKITKHNFAVGKDPASADPARFSIIISEKRPQPRQNLLTGIRIYPNPVTDQTINLQFNNQQAGSYEVRLVNSIGQVVFSRKVQYDGGLSTQKLKLEKYPKGMYQLEISGEGKKNSYSLLVAGY